MLMNLDVVIMQYKRGNNSVNVIRYLNGKGLIFELDNEKRDYRLLKIATDVSRIAERNNSQYKQKKDAKAGTSASFFYLLIIRTYKLYGITQFNG